MAKVGRPQTSWSLLLAPPPPSNFIAGRPKRHLFCFGSLVVLVVVCGYLLLFLLNIKIGKKWCSMWPPVWEMAVQLAVAGDVFDGVLFCAVLLSHEMSWMRSWNELNQFLRISIPTSLSKTAWYRLKYCLKNRKIQSHPFHVSTSSWNEFDLIVQSALGAEDDRLLTDGKLHLSFPYLILFQSMIKNAAKGYYLLYRR